MTFFLLVAAPADAQTTYSNTLSQGDVRTGVVTSGTQLQTVARAQEFARTGADNTVPLAQAGIVLLGGGSLLVIVARRRRTERRKTAR